MTNIICLEDEAFYALIDLVIERLKEKHQVKIDKWILPSEAMRRLGITSKTTLQKYRDEGRIRFSQDGKIIFMTVTQLTHIWIKTLKTNFNGRERAAIRERI